MQFTDYLPHLSCSCHNSKGGHRVASMLNMTIDMLGSIAIAWQPDGPSLIIKISMSRQTYTFHNIVVHI